MKSNSFSSRSEKEENISFLIGIDVMPIHINK
jgi:hypothetical protein